MTLVLPRIVVTCGDCLERPESPAPQISSREMRQRRAERRAAAAAEAACVLPQLVAKPPQRRRGDGILLTSAVRKRIMELRERICDDIVAADAGVPADARAPAPPKSVPPRFRPRVAAATPAPPSAPAPPEHPRPLRRSPRPAPRVRIPARCKQQIAAACSTDRRRAAVFLFCMRKLAERAAEVPVFTDNLGDALRYLLRKNASCPRVLIVKSQEVPSLCGRYTKVGQLSRGGMPVWACGHRRLYSCRGFWSVVHGEENMLSGDAALVSGAEHCGTGPHEVKRWIRGMSDLRDAAQTEIRVPQVSPSVFLSPDH
eukprot:TRINITY_DN16759_c0_g1_i1.p1 TRINITY_DN16759_c0_g1~~TRINITY_DN16759_c0_g1_i1.p1  ORF type:complete len:314 (+),score=109.52 TRINITY_DN16759_c0_g1_i1:126-1067(+)